MCPLWIQLFLFQVEGGIDFNGAELDPETGKFCVYKEMEVEALDKKPVLQCTHSWVNFQNNPSKPLQRIALMVNLDMLELFF